MLYHHLLLLQFNFVWECLLMPPRKHDGLYFIRLCKWKIAQNLFQSRLYIYGYYISIIFNTTEKISNNSGKLNILFFILVFWDNIYHVKIFCNTSFTCIKEYTNSIVKWLQRCRKCFIDYCFPKTSYIMHDNRNVTPWIQNIHPILENEHEQKLQDVWASFVLFDLCYVCSFI